jgi:FkbM family methyltransferase
MESALLRQGADFTTKIEKAGERIVLYGAGRLGRKVAAALRKKGIYPVAFADNDSRLQGTEVDGIRVLSPATAAERWRNEALFVVTTFLPVGGGVRSRLYELADVGCRNTASFLPLGWKHEGVLPHFGADLPSRFMEQSRELARIEDIWWDELSRETFRQELIWRILGDFTEIARPVPNQYFPLDILLPNSNEIFVDGGAFDGDTQRAAPWLLSKIIAVEPDPVNARSLRRSAGRNVELHEVLLGEEKGTACFEVTGTMGSSRADSGTLKVSVVTLDELTVGETPTYIKLDVEGDELAALKGGLGVLRRAEPVAAVCLYHRPEHLWMIPALLHEILPRHRMFLRTHAWDGFELVAYAVPPERCVMK